MRGFRIQTTDIGDTPPRLRNFEMYPSQQNKKIVAQKLSLLRVAGVTVRQGGPNVVLDLDVTYTGEAYLGVSVMKVIYLNKKCDKPDDRTDRNGQI